MSNVCSSEVCIYAPGDPSVGIPSTTLNIDLNISIDDEKFKEYIRELLKNCFNEIYDDCVTVMFQDEIDEINKKENMFFESKEETKMKFRGDIIITDPCYIIRDENQMTKDDWEECNYGENMEALGIKNYLTRETIYGDWSCTTYNKDTGEEIGKFGADAGLVSVFLLSEVLAYNPDFDYHISKPWTTTLIKDFDGYIRIREIDVVNEYTSIIDGGKKEVRVIGEGNINFFTTQTGF
jgi:hypothetical protein